MGVKDNILTSLDNLQCLTTFNLSAITDCNHLNFIRIFKCIVKYENSDHFVWFWFYLFEKISHHLDFAWGSYCQQSGLAWLCWLINLFHVTGLFQYSLKSFEKPVFYTLRGYKKRSVEWKELIKRIRIEEYVFELNSIESRND